MVGKPKSIKINALMNTIKSLTMLAFPLVTFPYSTRVLGPEGVGKINFAISFVEHFALLASLGIPMYGIRAVARARDDREKLNQVAQELFYLHLSASAAMFLIFAGVVFSMGSTTYEPTLLFVASSSMWLSVLGTEWLFQGREEYVYITLRGIAFALLGMFGLLMFVRSADDYVAGAAMSILSTGGGGILNFLHSRRILLAPRREGLDFRKHLKPLGLSMSMSVLSSIYLSLDVVLLGLMAKPVHVGYYVVATKLNRMMTGLIASLGNVLMPRMSFYAEKGEHEAFSATLSKSLRVTCMVAIPCVFGLLVLAEDAVRILAGDAYHSSVACVRIVSVGLIFSSLASILAWQVLFPKGRDAAVLKSLGIAASASIVTNIVLIRQFQHLGASIALLLSEMFVFASLLMAGRRDFMGSFSWRPTFQYLFAAIAMAIVIHFSGTIWGGGLGGTMAAALAGASIYFVLLLLMRDGIILGLIGSFLKRRSGG